MNAIEVHNLHYTYEDGTAALHGISFTVREGESIGLIGPNGAGKTTLLLHLNGYFRNGNTVKIFDRPVTKKILKEVRRDVGLVMQDSDNQLFMLTVQDDIAFGPVNMGLPEAEVRKRVASSLAAVGLTGCEQKSPHHLSGGEKRAVAIASVLSMQPRILVMDEPTSNLDPRTRRSLIHMVKSLHQTKIIASHDLEMILELCDRCILLDKGKTIVDGNTDVTLSDEELLLAHGLEMPVSLKRCTTK